MVKNLLQCMRFLEKGKPTHSSILPWGIPWTEELGRLQSTVSHNTTEWLTHTHIISVLFYLCHWISLSLLSVIHRTKLAFLVVRGLSICLLHHFSAFYIPDFYIFTFRYFFLMNIIQLNLSFYFSLVILIILYFLF